MWMDEGDSNVDLEDMAPVFVRIFLVCLAIFTPPLFLILYFLGTLVGLPD